MDTADLTRIRGAPQALMALNHLKLVNTDLALTGKKLAFGMRVVRAADDPAGYRIGVILKSRSRGLGVALDNIQSAQNMLTVAEGGLTKIKDLLLKIRDHVVKAANDSLGLEEGLSLGAAIRDMMHEIVRIAHETRWGDLGLLDSSPPPNASSTVSLKYVFHTGSAPGDDTTWERSFVVDTLGMEDDKWTDWKTYAATLAVRVATPENPHTAVSRIAYNSTSGLTNASAEFSLKLVYESLGIAEDAGILGARDTTNINASANELLMRIDATISAITEWISSIGSVMGKLQNRAESVMVARTNIEASRSRIIDADMARQNIRLVRDQILQNTSLAFLSHASASAEGVIRLMLGE